MQKQLFVVLFSLFFLSFHGHCLAGNDIEPNNSKAKAQAIKPGETVQGMVHYGDSDGGDFFKTSLPADSTVTVKLWDFPGDCRFRLVVWGKSSNSTEFMREVKNREPGKALAGSWPVAKGTDLYIMVEPLRPFSGSFSKGSWNTIQFDANQPYHVCPAYNREPEDVPARWNKVPVLGPITYKLQIDYGGTGISPGASPSPPSQVTSLNMSEPVVIKTGDSWAGVFSARKMLKVEARLDYSMPAGANLSMVISVNGRNLVLPLRNKKGTFTFADGRTFPYFDAKTAAWSVFYSHDFSANNSQAARGYEILTDRGQSYLYEWDISQLIQGGEVKLRIRNINPKASLVFKARLQEQ